MNWLRALLSSNDDLADSIILAGLAAMVALIFCQAWATIKDPALFGAINFGTAAGAIIGAIGTAKGLRDRLTPQQPQQEGQQP